MKCLLAFTLGLVVACGQEVEAISRKPQIARTVLVFADVTSSLSTQESDRVGQLTAEVLESLPPGTYFAVYAIQADAEAPAFCDGQMPIPRNSRERDDAIAGRKQLQGYVKTRLADLYCSINWNDPKTQQQCRARKITPNPQEDLRSCVLRSLNHAAKAIANAESAQRGPVEIVFISDMIEECRETPFGSPVRLTRTSIRQQTEAAAKLSIPADLRNTRVTMVLPRVLNDSAGTPSSHPMFGDVENFWKVVFTRAKADMSRWYFHTELPPRMRK